MRESELFMFAVLLAFVSGQEQFLREVKNPTGPSQIILRGGFLNSSPNEGQVQQQNQVPVQNQPQQAVPLQVNFNSEDEDVVSAFINGNDGVRYNPPSPQVAPQPVQQQQGVYQQPQTVFQQEVNQQGLYQQQQVNQGGFQQHLGGFQQQQVNQGTFYQPQQPAPVTGNSFSFTPLGVLNHIQSPAKPHTVQKHALVDQYGRKLAEYETQVPIRAAVPQTSQSQPGTAPTQVTGQTSNKAHAPVHQVVQHQGIVPVAHSVPYVQQQHFVPVQSPQYLHHPQQPIAYGIQNHGPVLANPVVHAPIVQSPIVPKHIYNVLHGSEPLIFQDACTTDPSQKNVRACVFKQPLRSPVKATSQPLSSQQTQTLDGRASSIVQSPSNSQTALTSNESRTSLSHQEIIQKEVEAKLS